MSNSNSKKPRIGFDLFAKEKQLKADSETWDTSNPEAARDGDIPIIDLHDYFDYGSSKALRQVADELGVAGETVGFFSIRGHQVALPQIAKTFEMVRKFHALSIEQKNHCDGPIRLAGRRGRLFTD